MTRLQRYGPWAIVTGASSGIGEGFAEELASHGLGVVLVARRAEKLNALSARLEAQGARARVVAIDLTEEGAAAKLMDQTEDLDVGMLVSNAGAAHMGGFLQNHVEDLARMVNLNALAHLRLVHRFATRLRKAERPGGILLLSSTAALQPVPLAANYSAAKAYLIHLGEALNTELRTHGIGVCVLIPGPTKTPALLERPDIDLGRLPMPAMSARAVAKEGLRALQKGRGRHVAGRLNRFMARFTPRWLGSWMFHFLMRRAAPRRLLPDAVPADDAV